MYKKRLKIKPIIEFLRAGENVYDACAKAKISYRTFKRWQDADPRLTRIVDAAEEISENKRIKKVEASLYKRAIGYKYREITFERSKLNPSKKIQKIIIKEISPDPTAAMFYLMNRAPDRWADKRAVINNTFVANNKVGGNGSFTGEDRELQERIKAEFQRFMP